MNFFILVILAVLLSLTYILWQQIKQQKGSYHQHRLDKSLNRQLLTMMGGDKKAVLRLLRNARKNHPGKNYLWYYEKVIRDLERDRRY